MYLNDANIAVYVLRTRPVVELGKASRATIILFWKFDVLDSILIANKFNSLFSKTVLYIAITSYNKLLNHVYSLRLYIIVYDNT